MALDKLISHHQINLDFHESNEYPQLERTLNMIEAIKINC